MLWGQKVYLLKYFILCSVSSLCNKMKQDLAMKWTLIQADTFLSRGGHAFLIGTCAVVAFNIPGFCFSGGYPTLRETWGKFPPGRYCLAKMGCAAQSLLSLIQGKNTFEEATSELVHENSRCQWSWRRCWDGVVLNIFTKGNLQNFFCVRLLMNFKI